MKKYLYLTAVVLCSLALASCWQKNDPQNEIEYYPFQSSKDGLWGLISPDGEVLFADEFKNEPTVAINGRFMVKNSEGLWEIYTAEQKPEKIGGEYLQAGLFYENVAPVVEQGKPIQLIDRNGNVKVTLDKIDGKPITKCTNFTNGLACVQIGDAIGAIDTDGDLVIIPEYIILHPNASGNFFAINKKYKDANDLKNAEVSILNNKGKEIASLKGSKFEELRSVSTNYRCRDITVDNFLVVATKKNDKLIEGLMGFDGEWVLKPNDKIETFHEYRKGLLTFSNNEGTGLTNTKGEMLIRPKFAELAFIDDNLLQGKKTGKEGLSLYNLEGEKISKEDYVDIFMFHDGLDYTFAKVGKGDYTLLNRKGEEKKLKADVYNVTNGVSGDSMFEGDYVDLDLVVSRLKITEDGFLGLTTSMTVPEAIETFNNVGNLAEMIVNNPEKYKDWGEAGGAINFGKATVQVCIDISTLLQKQRVQNGYWSTIEYSWSSAPVSRYKAFISCVNTQQLHGQMNTVYTKIADAVKPLGGEVKKGKNATVVDVGNNNYYWVYCTGETVYIEYGHLNVDQCATTEYDNVSEENPAEEEYEDDGPEPGFDE